MAEIRNEVSATLLSGTRRADDIYNGWISEETTYSYSSTEGGKNVTIEAGAGDDNIENHGYNVTISGDNGDDIINNGGLIDTRDYNGSYVSISGGAGNDIISNGYLVNENDEDSYSYGGDKVTISGDNGDDVIYNAGQYASISGGTGDDTIKTTSFSIYDSDNSTILGGKGDDVINLIYDDYNAKVANVLIQYATGDGDDTIFGFNGTDTLQITQGSYSTTRSGDDVIVKVGSGSITLKDVYSANIDGELALPTNLAYNSNKTKITASAAFTQSSFSMVNYPKVQFFDGQKITNNVKITGNSLDNTIEGGKKTDTIYGGAGNDRVFGNGGNDKLYGGAGNDTLYGGGGDDTLTGGKGNDVFSYSSGDDVITDYTEKEDYIRLYKCSITGSSVKGKNVILKTTTGNITIKNGKGKEISVLTTQVYGNSTSKLFAEDNFMTADNISEIVAEKSVGEFEFNSSEKLSQENLITFAG